MALGRLRLWLLGTPSCMLLRVKLSVNTLIALMGRVSLPPDSEPVETTGFKLSIHSRRFGLPSSGTPQLLMSEEELEVTQALDQAQAPAPDGLISLAWVEAGQQAVEEAQLHQSQTMELWLMMQTVSQWLWGLGPAQESNRQHRCPRRDRTWRGKVCHHPREGIICWRAPAGDDLLVYRPNCSGSYYNNGYIS